MSAFQSLQVLSKEPAAAEERARDEQEEEECMAWRTCDDLVPIGIVERDRIHHIPMAFQGQQLVSGDGIPYFTCTIIRSCDELVPGLVERTVRQWEDVCAEDLEQEEIRRIIRLQALYQLCRIGISQVSCKDAGWGGLTVDHSTQVRALGLRDQRLLENDLIDDHVHIRTSSKYVN